MAFQGGERDAAKGGQGGGDIGRRRGLEVFPGLNAITHKKHRHALIVGIRTAVRGAVGADRAGRGRIPGPVRVGVKEEGSAAGREGASRVVVSWSATGRGR